MDSRKEEKCTIFVVGDIATNRSTQNKESSSTSVTEAVVGEKSALGERHNTNITIQNKVVPVEIINNEPRLAYSDAIPDIVKYSKVNGFVVTMDMTDSDAVRNLKNWLSDIRRSDPDIPIVVIGTKTKENSNLMVDTDDVKYFLKNNYKNCEFVDDSHLSNIENAFSFLVSKKLQTDANNKNDLLDTIKTCIEKNDLIKKTEGTKDVLKVIDSNQLTDDEKLKQIEKVARKKHDSTSFFSHSDANTNKFWGILIHSADNPKSAAQELVNQFPVQAPKQSPSSKME